MPDAEKIIHLVSPRGNWEPFARVASIAASLRGEGFTSIVAAPDHSRLWELAEAGGVDVVDFALERSLNPLRWKELGNLIRTTGAGIVHVHDAETAVLAGRARLFVRDVALVTSRYDLHEQPGSAEYGGGVDMIVAPSRAVADAMKAKGASEDRLRVIYDGASLAMADSAAPERDGIRARYREQYCPEKAKPLFLVSIAPLDEWGGQEDIVEAMPEILALLPQAHLFLMGEGDRKGALEHQCKMLAVSGDVSILEPDKAFHRLLAGADLYVASARGDVSGFMAQAAMMAGRGVVARPSGCYPELIGDGATGLFARGDSAADLKTAILDLLQSRSRRERIGKAARARAIQEFNIPDLAARMAAAYREAYSAPTG